MVVSPCVMRTSLRGCGRIFFIWKYNNPFLRHIIYYGRYIDGALLIWNGGKVLLMSFVAHCNGNNLGLSFTHVIDPDSFCFLGP